MNFWQSITNKNWRKAILGILLGLTVITTQPVDDVVAPRIVQTIIYLPIASNQFGACFSSQEVAKFVGLFLNNNQERPILNCNLKLLDGANKKAKDLAKRKYFSHVTPDGIWPNQLVREAGCNLPTSYQNDANYVESIVAGTASGEIAYYSLFNSDSHHDHIVGAEFFESQTEFAIGYFEDKTSPYKFYWVVWTAICE